MNLKSRLEELKQSPGFLQLYTTAMQQLYSTGIFTILNELGKIPFVPPNTPNYTAVMQTAAAESFGYNQCLDDLLDFRIRYLEDKPKTDSQGTLAFAKALETEVEAGNLTREEADAIRHGNEPPALKREQWSEIARNRTDGK